MVLSKGASWWIAPTRSTPALRSAVASSLPTSRSPYRIGSAKAGPGPMRAETCHGLASARARATGYQSQNYRREETSDGARRGRDPAGQGEEPGYGGDPDAERATAGATHLG